MIFDTIPHLLLYLPSDVWNLLEPFISQLHPSVPDGKHWLQEPDVFAQISSYQTKPPREGRVEAHQRFVDIQIVLSGSEIIEVTPLCGLIPETEDDEQNDIRFYKVPDVPAVRLLLTPGSFALFYPQDTHRPGLTPHSGTTAVKKVIIKIDRHRIGGNAGPAPDLTATRHDIVFC